MTPQFLDMTSLSDFVDIVLFLLSSLVTGPNFTSVSSLVLELWQFSFIRDWPKITKSEIHPSEFCPISGDWRELWILNLSGMSPLECCWMLQNSSVTVIKGKQTGEGRIYHPPPPRLGLKYEQCIFIINDPAATERNNFQQLIKIDWTKIYFNNLTTIVYYYK